MEYITALTGLSEEYIWIVILAFIISFVVAFGVGANDVANSYGTSVGSGVLTFRQACILATFCETAGAVLLGYKVADTMRKKVVDVTIYENDEITLMYGMLSALFGSAVWLLIATFLRLPVSTTHSIVGSTVGFSLVAKGTNGLNVRQLIQIVISWFVSPVCSGLVGVAIYFLIKKLILSRSNPVKCGLIALPLIYGLTVFVNVLSITFGGSKLLGLQDTPLWLALTISFSAMAIVALLVQFILVPWQRRKLSRDTETTIITKHPKELESGNYNGISNLSVATVTISRDSLEKPIIQEENSKVTVLFHFLQTLTAIFTSFVHGGNDVSNAIGPLIAIWMIYKDGNVLQKAESPIYLLLYGGLGMVIGLWLLGRRVNETIGKNITKINPINGFTIESSAALTVLLATKIGIPVSTTHCLVGSVVFVGWTFAEDRKVNWGLFRSIFFAWVVTLPVAGSISAFCMFMFQTFG